MSFLASMFYPLVSFFNAYKWYVLIAVLLYLVLTILFRHSRVIITVVFGVCVLIFVLTHLGGVYGSINELMTDIGDNSQIAMEEYSAYVEENILRDEATPDELLQRALNYGILGKEDAGDEKLPSSDDMTLSETIDYVADVDGDGNSTGAAKALLDKIVAIAQDLYDEIKVLFGI